MRRWHKGSLFGPGPRRPLDRNGKARWRWLVRVAARASRITPKAEWVAEELLDHLGTDGRCDPSYERIASTGDFCSKTAERAVERLEGLSLLRKQRRLVRRGWRTEQTSNAYELIIPGEAEAPPPAQRPASRAKILESCSKDSLSTAANPIGLPPGFEARAAAKIAEEKRILRERCRYSARR